MQSVEEKTVWTLAEEGDGDGHKIVSKDIAVDGDPEKPPDTPTAVESVAEAQHRIKLERRRRRFPVIDVLDEDKRFSIDEETKDECDETQRQ